VVGSTGTSIDLTSLAAIQDPNALISQLSQTLMHGTLSSQASGVILTAVTSQSATDPLAAARAASYLVLTSAQYQVER